MSIDIAIHIFVDHGNEDAAAAFYQTAFGFIEISRGEIDGTLASVVMRAGDVEFNVVGSNPNREADPSRGGPFSVKEPGKTSVVFTLKVNDIAGAFEKALASGASTRSNIDSSEDGTLTATLFDPFGHIWAIVENNSKLYAVA
jgi:uncharacterized glyoxalase superfamily protein PhnB